MEDKYKNSSGDAINLQTFTDNLSDFLKVANVIHSNLESVSNIPNAAKTLSQIIKGIDKFPKESIDVKNQSNALTSVSAAIKKLTTDDKFSLNSINESIMNSLFHPDKFKNTVFQEVEELDPSMLNILGKESITEEDLKGIDKIKTNHFVNNLLLTSKYVTSIFNSVGSFASLCTKEKIEGFNNISSGISVVYTAFNAALLEIAKTSKDLLDFKDLPAAQEILAIVEKFKQDSLIYEADEMVLFELEEKLKTDDGLTDKEAEKYNRLKNRKKPQNFFETISALNTGIFGIFKSISEFGKLEPVNPAKVLLNVQLSVWNLNMVIRQIPKIIQQIDANGLRKIALDMSPKATDHIIKSVFNTGSSTTTNEEGISETVSNSNNKENIIKESIQAMSPFDLIKCIFEMIDGLNNLKVINPVKAWLAIQSLQITIEWVEGGIAIVLKSLIGLGRRLTNVIKTSKETSDNIKSIFDSLKSISDNIIYVGKWAIPAMTMMPLVSLFSKSLGGFIKTILKHLSMDDAKNNKAEVDISDAAKTAKVETKNGSNKVTFLGSVIQLLKEVMITSAITIGLGVLVVPALAAMIVVSLFLFAIKAFVWMAIKMANEIQKTVDKIAVKNNKNESNNKDDSNKVIIFAGVYTILKDLNKIALQTILLSVLTIPALIAMGVTLLFVGGLILFIYAVGIIESLLSDKIVENIKYSFRQIWNIIKLITGIAAMTVLLVVVAVVAIPALIIDLIFVALLTGFIFVTNILLKIIKIKAKDILSMILLIVFIGMLVVVALAVSKLSEIGSKIDWIGVLSIMGAILVFSVLAIGIGLVASLILPIIGIAALGLLGIIILIGLLTLTAWMLYELQNFELDSEKIKSVVTSIINSIKLIISTIFGPDETEEEKSDKGWFGSLIDVVGGPFRKLKTVAESLLTVPFLLSAMISIGCLFLIANMLEKISVFELSDNLEAKIKQIIGAAKSVITAINTPGETTSQEDEKDKSWLSSVGEFLGDRFKNIGQVLSNISSAGVLISLLPNICLLRTIIDVLNDIDKYNVSGNISDKVTQIVQTAQIVSASISDDSKVDTIDPKKVRQFGNFVDDSIKYFKHINKLDVSKVKSIGDMYEKMGQFMEKLQDVPIGEIADALVNKISPALSDINNNLDKNNQQATQQTQQSQANQQTNSSNSTTNNYYNSEQQKNIDYTSMLENIEDLLEQIKKKLNSQPQPAF